MVNIYLNKKMHVSYYPTDCYNISQASRKFLNKAPYKPINDFNSFRNL